MVKISAGIVRTELLEIADTVAREKNIHRDEILDAMQTAIQKAAHAKYGLERLIRADINKKTGEISLFLQLEVVESVDNDMVQISLEDARKINPELQVGEFLEDLLPPIEFGRVGAQTAKQVIFQRVRDAERQRQFDEYKNRIGEIISGVVKRVEFGNAFIELNQVEAYLAKDQMIQRENFKPGDRVRAYIVDVRSELRGPQVFLSRTHSMFMAKLFAQEVPEVYDGDIEIKAVARDPGSRAKMAVCAGDKSLDAVGACVGVRGSRVQAIVNELQGEKVDIIPWSSNPAVFVVNALVPAEVLKVVIDEDKHLVEVVVPDDQLSLAIGRRGQNVRLASELTKWNIDVISDALEAERRNKDTKIKTDLFVKALDVDDVIARLLVAEGFESVEDVAYVDGQELSGIDGFEESLALELQKRAKSYLLQQESKCVTEFRALGGQDDLMKFEGLQPQMLVQLALKGVKSLDDFAGLAGDELVEIIPEFSQNAANDLIMKARAHWFQK